MRKIELFFKTLLFSLTLFSASSADTLEFPMIFYGNITINGTGAVIGTEIKAYCGNTDIELGSIITDTIGKYGDTSINKLVVNGGCDENIFIKVINGTNSSGKIDSNIGFIELGFYLYNINATIVEQDSGSKTSSSSSSSSKNSGGGGGGGLGYVITVGNKVVEPSFKRSFETKDNLDLKKLEDGKLPVAITMKHTFGKYYVEFPEGVEVLDKDGNPFTGKINAPKKISNTTMPKHNGKKVALRALEIGPSDKDIKFSEPVKLVFSYAGISSSIDPNDIRIYSYNKETGEYILEDSKREVDEENKTITIYVNHFTKFVMTNGELEESGSSNSNSTNKNTLNNSQTPFTDITSHWSKSYVESLYSKGVLANKSKYNPDEPIKRVELVKMVIEAFGYEKSSDLNNIGFNDIDMKAWYASYLSSAVSNGIVDGPTKNSSFRPGENVDRAEAMKTIMEASRLNVLNIGNGTFNDIPNKLWYAKYINFAASKSIVSGYGDGTFRPGNNVTRGEVAKIIMKTIELRD